MLATMCAMMLCVTTPARDTTLTLQGVVAVSGDAGSAGEHAVMVLTEPILAGGRQMWVLPLAGEVSRWRDWDSRYVEATGTLSAAVRQGEPFTVQRVRDVEPDSAARGEVTSPSHHSNVLLSVVPRRFSAVPGQTSGGITPLIYYKITVQGQTNLTFETNNNEFICVSLQAPGRRTPGWYGSWKVQQERPPYVVRIGPVFRVLIPIPGDQLGEPGRYTVRATVCGSPEFNLTTTIDVTPA